ncbi:MAG: glycoside hydrolase family protein [Melioribacteraceae bacterium]|jgi:lysozyme|nr:glycoside hydrolase family protein [Melioribacteraceae bacterium]
MEIDAKSLIAKNENTILKLYDDKTGKPINWDAIRKAGLLQGKVTIGTGHNIEDNGIIEEQADMLLDYDIGKAYNDLNRVFGDFADSTDNISDNRYAALTDMMFNMGKPTFLKFEKMIAAVKQGDWSKAADELKDSAYYKQVGNRAKANENILRYDTDETQ